MSDRSAHIYITDILESITKIERYINGLDYEAFAQNEMVVDAVLRNLEVIGEAVKNIPEDVRNKYTDVPWKKIVGLRNVVIHEYFGIDLENIWMIITVNIVEVKPFFEDILKDILD